MTTSMESTSVREKDPDGVERRRVRVLCLDGGGARIRSTARFLELMQAVTESGSVPLRDKFDVFVGTSAGGLTALWLASRPVDAQGPDVLSPLVSDDAIRAVMSKGHGVLLGGGGGTGGRDKQQKGAAERNSSSNGGQSWSEWAVGLIQQAQRRAVQTVDGPKYDGLGKRAVVDATFPADATMGELPRHALDVAYDITSRSPVAHATRDDVGPPSLRAVLRSGATVRDAADATSAAPTYFPPVNVCAPSELTDSWQVDGGVSANDPVPLALAFARALFPDPATATIDVLSVGTGGDVLAPMTRSSAAKARKSSASSDDGDDDVARWGALRWLEHGILELLEAAPNQMNAAVGGALVEQQGGRFLRVEPEYPTGSVPALDDTSDEALRLSDQAGTAMWSAHAAEVERWLEA
jgi:predicted acylesterase/phospholipase RssA